MSFSTILIVDDNEVNLAFQSRTLEDHVHGCDVLTASNVDECLFIAKARSLTVIVINMRLPEIEANKGIRRLKFNMSTRHVPILLITPEQSTPQQRLEGLEAGADDVLSRPVDRVDLVAKVRVMQRIKKSDDECRAANKRLEELVSERTTTLLAREERYRQVIEFLPDLVAVCDGRKIVFVNEAGRTLLEAPRADLLVGEQLFDFVDESSVETVEDFLKQSNQKKRRVPLTEIRLTTLDGKVIDVEASALPMEYLGRPHVQFIARDITERKQMEKKFGQSQRMEAVGRLAGGVAHDFNNVLTTIRGFSELLLDSLGADDPLSEDVEEIRRATERAAGLTRQLLAFSRRQVLEPRALDLNSVVMDMKRMLKRTIGEDIELVTDVETDLGTIKADRSQIEQVVMNLAVNARDAMPEGGKLSIRTDVHAIEDGESSRRLDLPVGDYVLFEVADSGTGMSPETVFQIFEPFFTTKEKDRGTGLGLSTVYGIVKQSGGEIGVSSELGSGTTFSIYFPIVEDSVVPMEPIPLEKGSKGGMGDHFAR